MLTTSDIEREKYESRRKFQLDQDSAIIGAVREAKLEGKLIGLIHAYQQILLRPETPEEQLLALSHAELTRLSEELKQQALGKR